MSTRSDQAHSTKESVESAKDPVITPFLAGNLPELVPASNDSQDDHVLQNMSGAQDMKQTTAKSIQLEQAPWIFLDVS